jgi:aryl-alcohol dehydrogenase-like predicted oxidoreductase
MKKHAFEIGSCEVSAICLGTMHFGTITDTVTSYDLLDRYVEAGGNFLDTANNYATWVPGGRGGESETLLGRWIKERGNSSHLFVATKVGFPVTVDEVGMGLTVRQIEAECERSLRRLGVETIDLYYAHRDDRETPLEESLEAFHKLVKAGKVRFIGASNFVTWRLEEARWISRNRGWPEFCCIQQRYSYLRPASGADFDPQLVGSAELLDFCRSRNMQLLAYSPLLKGAYGRSDRPLPPHYKSPESESQLTALRAVAGELGATPNQAVLAWLMQSEPETIPVIGVSSLEQLEENLGALDITLSEDQILRLSSAGNIPTSHFDARRRKSRLAK